MARPPAPTRSPCPPPCDHSDSADYAVRHNPWAYIPAEAACRGDDVPVGTPTDGALASDVRAGILPNAGLLTPNLIDDAHDGTLRQADAFLRQWIPVITYATERYASWLVDHRAQRQSVSGQRAPPRPPPRRR